MSNIQNTKEKSELRISDFNTNVKNDLIKISKREGYSNLSSFLKVKIKQIRDSYPKHLLEDEN